jgi:hypothetical protein
MRTSLFFIAAILAGLTATAAQASQQELTGRFEGGYECAQGTTWLRLETKAKSNGAITATFTFGSAAERGRTINVVPDGKFALSGRWNGRHFQLEPAKWIKRPEGFTMVGLTGDADGTGALTGDVNFPGCSVFSVRRR